MTSDDVLKAVMYLVLDEGGCITRGLGSRVTSGWRVQECDGCRGGKLGGRSQMSVPDGWGDGVIRVVACGWIDQSMI